MKKILITGGAGFIGSAFVKKAIKKKFKLLILDKLSYSADINNIKNELKNTSCQFKKLDICNFNSLKKYIFTFSPDIIINFAAESHVDRSIDDNKPFIESNIIGTYNLLEAFRLYLKKDNIKKQSKKFIQVSTDEVYGDLKRGVSFTEKTKYDPSSPYSSTKASSDLLVKAWSKTYNLPTVITNCTNNFGPRQHPEKLIPHMIISALNGRKLPIYGNGLQVRDWIHVNDHVDALFKIIRSKQVKTQYNIGANNPLKNIYIVKKICKILDIKYKKNSKNSFLRQISFVEDRPAHDTKYLVSADKIMRELKWKASKPFDVYLSKTVHWYLKNQNWWKSKLKKNYKLKRIGKLK